MTSPEEIRAAYAENEASMQRLVPFMTDEDRWLCLTMTAEQTGETFNYVRSVMTDGWAMKEAG